MGLAKRFPEGTWAQSWLKAAEQSWRCVRHMEGKLAADCKDDVNKNTMLRSWIFLDIDIFFTCWILCNFALIPLFVMQEPIVWCRTEEVMVFVSAWNCFLLNICHQNFLKFCILYRGLRWCYRVFFCFMWTIFGQLKQNMSCVCMWGIWLILHCIYFYFLLDLIIIIIWI